MQFKIKSSTFDQLFHLNDYQKMRFTMHGANGANGANGAIRPVQLPRRLRDLS